MTAAANILTPDWSSAAAESSSGLSFSTTSNSLSALLKKVPSLNDPDWTPSYTRSSSGQDWSGLIDLVQNAARHSRDLETKAQEQDARVQELLDRVREDIRRAGEQVREAEQRARDAQAQADARVLAADERALAAEGRAQIAEQWLVRVQEAIVTGFIDRTPRDGA